MPYFHGIPVEDASIYPRWMHEQTPVMVFTLRKGQAFVGFASDGNCQRFRLGEKHKSPFVYHTTNIDTGERNCIGANALVWTINALDCVYPDEGVEEQTAGLPHNAVDEIRAICGGNKDLEKACGL